jgi:hypothetical protein
MTFTKLAAQTSATLEKLSAAVGAISLPTTFSLDFCSQILDPDSEPTDVTRAVDGWTKKGHRYIYYLTASIDSAQLQIVHRAYAEAKNHELDGRAFARLNEPPSQTFYVGSSASLGRRFREHLGYGARGTYALHLAQWARTLNLEMQLSAASYPAAVDENMIGVLEDELWERLKPMFGRKGRR